MTEVIANLFVDVHLSKPKLTLFLDGNCFVIPSTVSEYSLWQMLQRVREDGSTSSPSHASNDNRRSSLDTASQEM